MTVAAKHAVSVLILAEESAKLIETPGWTLLAKKVRSNLGSFGSQAPPPPPASPIQIQTAHIFWKICSSAPTSF